jgi:hypothetical protein
MGQFDYEVNAVLVIRHWRDAHRPKRVRGVIEAVCDICSYPVESDQHVDHCRG